MVILLKRSQSWLATKIFNGRLTFEQLQAQRRQLDEDILQATKQREEFEEPAINKRIKSFEREIQNLQSQIDHQEPILAELRRDIPNLEQISRVLNPPV